jgi:RimJ/RimL family protein N-acetyltransferase
MNIEFDTERLRLRSIGKKDISEVYAYRSDQRTNVYQGWIPTSEEEVEDFVIKRTCSKFNEPNTWHQLVIVSKEEKRIIGDVGIHFFDKESQSVELGCTLSKSEQGKGYAIESITSVIEFLVSKFDKKIFHANIIADNYSSITLFERAGFTNIRGDIITENGKEFELLKYELKTH